MALVIRDTSVTPPERWVYPAVAGPPVSGPNYPALLSEIEKHYSANNQPVPTEQTVIDWLCANVHVPCYDSETREPLINKWSMNLPIPVQSCCNK